MSKRPRGETGGVSSVSRTYTGYMFGRIVTSIAESATRTPDEKNGQPSVRQCRIIWIIFAVEAAEQRHSVLVKEERETYKKSEVGKHDNWILNNEYTPYVEILSLHRLFIQC